MVRRCIAAASLLFAAGCGTSEPFVTIGSCSASRPATGVARLDVHDRAGSITITPSAGDDVEVTAAVSVRESLRAQFPAADATRDLKIAVDGDTLRVADAHEAERGNEFQLDLVITAPARLAWNLVLGAGSVDATGGGNAIDVQSGAGNVRLTGAVAEVHANSGAGNVDADVATIAGGTLHSGAGSVNLAIASGRITEALTCTCGAGQVTISVPAGFSADVRLETGAGAVSLIGATLPSKSHVVGGSAGGRLGQGGPPLVANSGAGGIELRVRP